MSHTSSLHSARRHALLLTAFFLSGAVALVYQVLWTRQLGLVFGVTIQAASTVLACFMGGLAVGSYVAGRISDRLKHPLRAFALAETGIALSALATPALLGLADGLLVSFTPALEQSRLLTTIARVGLSALILLVPATLMGMTYPLVLRSFTQGPDGIRRSASLLYAVNTTGAIAGVLSGSLWLVPELGLSRTFLVAASVNALVAVIAWVASVSESTPPVSEPAVTVEEADSVVDGAGQYLTPAARFGVLIVIAMSGAVSLALEIIWFRILVFFLRPTTYAFACMLAAVLTGLAIGSYLVTPLMRRRTNWLYVLGVTEIAIGITGLLSAFAMVRGHDVMDWMFRTVDALDRPWDFVIPLFFAAAFAILPTAILLGAAFPIGLVLWTTGAGAEDARMGRRVGTLYALNVAGAIAGALAGGFLLIPAFGAQQSLIVVTAIPLIGGVALIWMASEQTRKALVPAAAAVLGFGAISFLLPDVFEDVISRRYGGHHVLWHSEDAQSTVSVLRHREDRVLLIDGMHHASDGAAQMRFHRAFGALAAAVHPEPRNVLVVGMGGGVTGSGVTIHPNTHTTVVELSPSVVKAGTWFERANRGLVGNPNVTFEVADGRHFLKTTQKKFDVITADLMLPHMAGAASLYSADYYDLARKVLAPGGIMVQWIPTDTDFQHKLMLRSFLNAFPHVTMWLGGSVVIGSNEPLRLKESDFAIKLEYPGMRKALEEAGLGTFAILIERYFTSRPHLERYVGSGEMLRDDKPVTEYFLSMPADSPPVDLRPYQGAITDITDWTPPRQSSPRERRRRRRL